MTPEQQKIEIAEACGWTFITRDPKYPHRLPPLGKRDKHASPLPDYLNDLNAIREACLWAIDNLWDSDQIERFTLEIERAQPSSSFTIGVKQFSTKQFDPYDTAQIIIRSSAADWCRAFLAASNLKTP